MADRKMADRKMADRKMKTREMWLNLFTTPIIPLLLLFVAGFHASALAQQRNNDPSLASVSGRVTIEGKPASGVVVVLSGNQDGREQRRFAVTTDAEGRFQFAGVQPGGYSITPHAYVFVLGNQSVNMRNRGGIVVGEGDTIDDVSIELLRGGVVTGRVIDEDGRPVVGSYVSLRTPPGDRATTYIPPYASQSLPGIGETDDRGVYRLFGVPPGRYLAQINLPTVSNGTRGYYLVFYPNTLDESKAKVIELAAGEEKTDINIATVQPEKTYTASGRLTDAGSGKPVSDVYIECQPTDDNFGKMSMVQNSVEFRSTGSDGRFRIVGLSPGQYRLSIRPVSEQGIEWYCDDLTIDVADEDVGGIELRAHRGASISGVVTVEGMNDPQLLRSLASVYARSDSQIPDRLSGAAASSNIDQNGGFRLSGLRPGEFQLGVSVNGNSKKGLSMQRLEVAGQSVRGDIELKEGQIISDARIVMVYGDGVVRGQLKFQNGEAPKNVCFIVVTGRKGECSSCEDGFFARVTAGGQYTLEGLPPGEYELTLYANACGAGEESRIPPAKQTIRVSNGVEARADFVVDLNKKDQ